MPPVTPLCVAGLQLILTTIVAVPTVFVVNPLAAEAVAFGGLVAVVNALLLNWRMRWGGRHLDQDAGWHFRQAFRSLFERFAMVAVLFALGLKLARLAPLPMLTGFVLAQLAWIAAPRWLKLMSKHG